MTITWINCSERMPDDDKTEIIVKMWRCNYYCIEARTLHIEIALFPKEHYEWVPYTEEAWSELTR